MKHVLKSILPILLMSTLALLVACGNPEPEKKEEPSSNPAFPKTSDVKPIEVKPESENPSQPNQNSGGITQTELNAILGTFRGNIIKTVGSNQQLAIPYEMVLSTGQYQGSTYLVINMRDSRGPLIAPSFMGMFIQSTPYGKSYRFVSSIQRSPNLYDLPISIEFNYFGGNQYTLVFKDCGFSSTQDCLYQARGVSADMPIKLR